MNSEYRSAVNKFLLLSVLSLIIFIIGYSDITVEIIYSDGLYQLSSVIQRFLTGSIPFATGDFLYLLLILYVIRNLFLFYRKTVRRQLKREDRTKIPLQCINFLFILYL